MKLRWAAPAIVAVAVSASAIAARAGARGRRDLRRRRGPSSATIISIRRSTSGAGTRSAMSSGRKPLAAQTPGELRIVLADMLGRLGLSHFAVIPSSAGHTGDRADAERRARTRRPVDQEAAGRHRGRRRRAVRPLPACVPVGSCRRIGATPMASLFSALFPMALPNGWLSSRHGERAFRACADPSDSPVEITFLDGSKAP